MTEHKAALEVWTVYDRPADYPAQVVARLFVLRGGLAVATGAVLVADSLEACRAQLPPGLFRLERHPEDDPAIVETWM